MVEPVVGRAAAGRDPRVDPSGGGRGGKAEAETEMDPAGFRVGPSREGMGGGGSGRN